MNEDREYVLKRSQQGGWMGYTKDIGDIPVVATGVSPLEVITNIDAVKLEDMESIKAKARQVAKDVAREES